MGNGRKSGYVNNASMVVNNDSVCMYNFGLKDNDDNNGDIDNVRQVEVFLLIKMMLDL